MIAKTAKEYDLVVIGEVNPDLILLGDVIPEFGQVEKLVEQAVLTIGSSSAIFACAAARLGLKVAFIGKTGDDVFGSFMRREIEAYGINTSRMVIDRDLKTGLSIILSMGNDRAILTFPGTISTLRFEEIDPGIFSLARHLHVGAYFILDELRPRIPELFELAHIYGLTTSLDTNYDPSGNWSEGLRETFRHTDIFLPNEGELLAITHRDNLDDAMDEILSWVPVVGVKMGAKGGIAARGAERAHAPGIPVQVVDTVGAGDTFDAGFIFGSLDGWELERTLRLACICGSLSTRAAGGTTAQPSLEEAMEYL